MKTCNKCGAAKVFEDFHRDRTSKDGHSYHCKTCAIKRACEHHAANKPPPKVRRRKDSTVLTRNNPVLMRSYRKAWAERNRDAVLAKHAAYRASDIGLEYARKTGKANTSRLSDSYVRSRLGLSAAQAPKELIEAKRLHLRLVRLLKELK